MPLCEKEILWTLYCGPFDINLKDLTPISFKYTQLEEIKKSIEKEGLINTFDVQWIIGDDKLTILRGNQRYEAVKQLGWTKVPCHLRIIVPYTQEVVAKQLIKFLPLIGMQSGTSWRLARTPKEWRNGK